VYQTKIVGTTLLSTLSLHTPTSVHLAHLATLRSRAAASLGSRSVTQLLRGDGVGTMNATVP
jgi:hypothetical protein